MIRYRLIVLGTVALLLSAVATGAADPLPIGPQVVGYTKVASEDGREEVQLLTVEFPRSEAENRLLLSIVNSDPYWHHFREVRMSVRVGGKVVDGGPRVLAGAGYSVTFALPGEADLRAKPLDFFKGEPLTTPPGGQPFASLALTDEVVRAATLPLRASVRGTDKLSEELSKVYPGPYLATTRLTCVPQVVGLRLGAIETNRRSRFSPVGGHIRTPDQLDWPMLFADKPDPAAAVAVRLDGFKGWFPCGPWKATDTPPAPESLK